MKVSKSKRSSSLCMNSFMILSSYAVTFVHGVGSTVVLSENIMKLTLDAAVLSSIIYTYQPEEDGNTSTITDDITGFKTSNYESIKNFVDEPDQALVVKTKDGYCYGVFRGTTMTFDDWSQNFAMGHKSICTTTGTTTTSTTNNNTGVLGYNDTNYTSSTPTEEEEENEFCCETRTGFYDAYYTNYVTEFEEELRYCVESCDNMDECLVLTGHSQGGALAALAGIRFSDLNPYVITFGQPPTISIPCIPVDSHRWYRYINTKQSELTIPGLQYTAIGLSYDPIPFAPKFGTETLGHTLILGADSIHVAYIGLDTTDQFSPLNVNGAQAHSMVFRPPQISDADNIGTAAAEEGNPGYYDRIKGIIDFYGHDDDIDDNYMETTEEEQENSDATASSTTKSLTTIEVKKSLLSWTVNVQGYAPTNYCTQNRECITDRCEKETDYSFPKCVATECNNDSDCSNTTNRCDSGLCIPKFGSCMTCDEDSDCYSGRCYLFHCAAVPPNSTTTMKNYIANNSSNGTIGEGSYISHHHKSTEEMDENIPLMDDQCVCFFENDCLSGRCEFLTKTERICESKLSMGSRCNENSDCSSGYCNYWAGGRCGEKRKYNNKNGILRVKKNIINNYEDNNKTTIDDENGVYGTYMGSIVITIIVIVVVIIVLIIVKVIYDLYIYYKRRGAGYEEIIQDLRDRL